jgi:tetratricopeptide (TPR) repeat protein
MMKLVCCYVFGFVCIWTSFTQDNLALDGAINLSADEISNDIEHGSRIAVVSFESESDAISDYIMEELVFAFEDRGFKVADRANLPYIRQELQLDRVILSEEDQKKIAKFVDAEYIITGQFIDTGANYRMRVGAIHAIKAIRAGGSMLTVSNNSQLKNMLAALQNNKLISRDNHVDISNIAHKTAGDWFDEGMRLGHYNKISESINAFSEALKINSDFAAAYMQRGRMLFASVATTDYIDKDLDFATVLIKGSKVSAQDKDILNRAVSDLSETLFLAPDLPVAYLDRGRIYNQLQNYTKAIADYTSAININPGFYEAYVNRGITYVILDENNRALSDLNYAISLKPNLAGAYATIGYMYLHLGEYNKAITFFDKDISLDPTTAGTHINRGQAYYYKGEYSKAIADYNRGIRLAPNRAAGYNQRGLAYDEQGDYQSALDDFNRAIRLEANEAGFYSNRAISYINLKEFDKAIQDCNQAIRLDPAFAMSYNNRGTAYTDKGDYDRALLDFNTAISLNPNVPEPYNQRGRVYFYKKNYKQAIKDFEQALKLNPNYRLARENLNFVKSNM